MQTQVAGVYTVAACGSVEIKSREALCIRRAGAPAEICKGGSERSVHRNTRVDGSLRAYHRPSVVCELLASIPSRRCVTDSHHIRAEPHAQSCCHDAHHGLCTVLVSWSNPRCGDHVGIAVGCSPLRRLRCLSTNGTQNGMRLVSSTANARGGVPN